MAKEKITFQEFSDLFKIINTELPFLIFSLIQQEGVLSFQKLKKSIKIPENLLRRLLENLIEMGLIERVEDMPEEAYELSSKFTEIYRSLILKKHAESLTVLTLPSFQVPSRLPKVWELIEHFKNRCRLKGWKAFEYEDLVEAQGEYHNFLWIHRIHFNNVFKNVVTNPWCSIREGISYRTVRVSYIAWVLVEAPPAEVGQAIMEEPNLSKRVAIYDLSQAYAGKPLCLKINETDSVVFQEFEKFLNTEYKLELRLFPLPP